MHLGGPLLGFLACRAEHQRQIPGRLVGQTRDAEGRRAFCLTLSTREQHIRREKATSNICTNQGLMALASNIHMSLLGKKGLREVALQSHAKAEYLKGAIGKLPGFRIPYSAPTFNEFVVEASEDAAALLSRLAARRILAGVALSRYDAKLAGSPHLWEDYEAGERIDHGDGMTIEESCHMTATRLYQNTAKVHFNQHAEKDGRFGRRIVYGGHVISLARALSFNGLANAFRIAGIHAGRHLNPCFAGDTVYAWSEVTAKSALPGRSDAGALRLRTIATKDRPCADFPKEGPEILLDLDYTILMPRR